MHEERIDIDSLDPRTKLPGFSVNGFAIGRQMFEKLTDEDRLPLVAGMSPAPVMEAIERMIRAKIGEMAADHFDAPEIANKFAETVRADFMANAMRDVHLGMLDGAKRAGILRV